MTIGAEALARRIAEKTESVHRVPLLILPPWINKPWRMLCCARTQASMPFKCSRPGCVSSANGETRNLAVKQRQIRLWLGQYREAVADGRQDGHARAPAIAIAGSEERSPDQLTSGLTACSAAGAVRSAPGYHFKTLKYQPQFPQRFGCIELLAGRGRGRLRHGIDQRLLDPDF